MATINSFADLMLDWQKVLSACADNASALTNVEPQRAQVEKMLKDAQDLKAQQDSHTAAKQAARQQLTTLLHDGREAVRRLRGLVKATLGTKNELLVRFGIAPIRPKARKAKTEVKKGAAPKPTETPPAAVTAKPEMPPSPAMTETAAPRNPTAP
jgi:hypothetical protein